MSWNALRLCASFCVVPKFARPLQKLYENNKFLQYICKNFVEIDIAVNVLQTRFSYVIKIF